MMFKKIMKFKEVKVIVYILIILILAIGIFLLIKPKEALKLKKEEMIIEYGQAISTDPKDYLNFDEVDSKKQKF